MSQIFVAKCDPGLSFVDREWRIMTTWFGGKFASLPNVTEAGIRLEHRSALMVRTVHVRAQIRQKITEPLKISRRTGRMAQRSAEHRWQRTRCTASNRKRARIGPAFGYEQRVWGENPVRQIDVVDLDARSAPGG